MAAFLYVPIPLSWVHKFAQENYEYFFVPASEWRQNTPFLKKLYISAVELKLREDWRSGLWNRVMSEGTADEEVIISGLRAIDGVVSSNIPHTPVAQTLFSSLVRGYGHCDQVNAAVAYAFNKVYGDSVLFALHRDGATVSHTVAKVKIPYGTVYLDIYGKVPMFGFRDRLTEEGREKIPLYRDVSRDLFPSEREFYEEGRVMSEYTFRSTVAKVYERLTDILKSRWRRMVASLFREAPDDVSKHTDDVEEEEEESHPAKKAGSELRKLYLEARIDHLYGNLDKARNEYAKIAETECEYNICKASRIFLEKLN